MNQRALALAVVVLVHLAPLASAEPILKPRKYYGPIPQSSLSLRVGTFGGASNSEMFDYLDGRLQPPFEAHSEDFGNALEIDASYEHKPHPRFGVRIGGSVSLLRSSGAGTFVPQTPDSVLPALKYEREFNVDLFVVELSGLYHFTDAAVQEFQPYLGGGFSLGFPHQTFKESRTVVDTGQPYTDPIPGIPGEASEWGFSPGAHLVGGILYYLNNRVAISGEGRLQLMESKFSKLEVVNEVNQLEPVNFVVDLKGFCIAVGMTYAF